MFVSHFREEHANAVHTVLAQLSPLSSVEDHESPLHIAQPSHHALLDLIAPRMACDIFVPKGPMRGRKKIQILCVKGNATPGKWISF